MKIAWLCVFIPFLFVGRLEAKDLEVVVDFTSGKTQRVACTTLTDDPLGGHTCETSVPQAVVIKLAEDQVISCKGPSGFDVDKNGHVYQCRLTKPIVRQHAYFDHGQRLEREERCPEYIVLTPGGSISRCYEKSHRMNDGRDMIYRK